jgi:hypothetical protein
VAALLAFQCLLLLLLPLGDRLLQPLDSSRLTSLLPPGSSLLPAALTLLVR